MPPTILVAESLGAELDLIRSWKAREIGTTELVARLEALERRTTKTTVLQSWPL